MTEIQDFLINLYKNILIMPFDNKIALFGSTLIFIIIFNLLKNKFFFFYLITLPATFFHELAHFIISAFLNGKPSKLSIIPSREENGWTLGYVVSNNSTWYNQCFISLAPFLLFPLAIYGLEFFILEHNIIKLFFYGYILGNLIEGSMPSSSDFSSAMKAPIPIILILSYVIYSNYDLLISFIK